MVYLLSIISLLGYAFQTALMTSVYRRMNPLTATAYRGFSLGISMVPLLLLASWENIGTLPAVLPLVALAGAVGAAGNACMALSVRSISVGIAHTISQSSLVASVVLLAYLAFGETLSLLEIGCLVFIVIGNILLGYAKGSETTSSASPVKGYLLAASSGVLASIGFTAFSWLSRTTGPFVAAYFWELMVGVTSFVAVYTAHKLKSSPVPSISWSDFWTILKYASPTALGTGGYALAVTYGRVGIVTAIVSTSIVVVAVLGRWLYQERLSKIQWCAVVIVVCAVVGLKLVQV